MFGEEKKKVMKESIMLNLVGLHIVNGKTECEDILFPLPSPLPEILVIGNLESSPIFQIFSM